MYLSKMIVVLLIHSMVSMTLLNPYPKIEFVVTLLNPYPDVEFVIVDVVEQFVILVIAVVQFIFCHCCCAICFSRH